ncbi:MAG: PH domain-containing protein [Planctomycetia bacterium]|nr:PH domain-containing protein [Planctomycetia bacterium]
MPDFAAQPPQIKPTARGVEYVLPQRVGGARLGCGVIGILFGCGFMVPPLMVLGMANQAQPGQGGWMAVLFAIPFLAVGLIAVCISLTVMFGRTYATIDDQVLLLQFGLGPLRFWRRVPLTNIKAVMLAPTAGKRLSGSADVSLTLADGKTFPMAQGLAPDYLRPIAEDLAARCPLTLDDRTRRAAADADAGPIVPRPPATIFRRENVVLTPAASSGNWLGLLIFAVIWNGISWTIAVVIFTQEAGVCPILFISLFLLVGLLAAAGTAAKMLAMSRFHPPVVTVSVQPLFLGEPFICQVVQRAKKLVQIDRINLKLICRESATYRSGTNTVTVNHDAWTAEAIVAEGATADPLRPIEALHEWRIPPDGMHTFHAARNKIEWILRVHTDVPRWPDYTIDLPLVVAPRRHAGPSQPQPGGAATGKEMTG